MDLALLFPVSVKVVLRRIPDEVLPLDPVEEIAVGRAVPKRRREFAAGRACAREALSAVGHPRVALPRLSNGCVAWPEGVVGAITHSREWTAAVVTRSNEALGVGIDLEKSGRMSRRAAGYALSPTELAACEHHPLSREVAWTAIFSAKESIYKCLYPLVRRYIGFHEAEITLGHEGSFTAALAADLEGSLPTGSRGVGRFLVMDDHVVTAFTLVACRGS